MSDTDKIKPQDILNAIDVNKINQNEKKRRGRPKKTQMISPNTKLKAPISDDEEQEEEEMILHLALSKEDLKMLNSSNIEVDDVIKNSNSNSSSSDEQEDSDKNKLTDHNLKQYSFIIKKLKDENDDLKKYINELTPMYYTEISKNIYPVDLKLFDMQNNILVPKKTNLCCFWCTYPFECLPTYLPEKYSDNKFYVTGCFCSFNCAGAYNLSLNDNKIWERYSLLKQMYYMINKDKIKSITDIEINIAGPKELLDKYGGPFSIIEYRKNSKILGREYHKLIPPFLPIKTGFEETTNCKLSAKNLNSNGLGLGIGLQSKADSMLKRNKPVSNIASKHIDAYIE